MAAFAEDAGFIQHTDGGAQTPTTPVPGGAPGYQAHEW